MLSSTKLRYLLDTDICIYIHKGQPEQVRTRFLNLRPNEAAMSIISYSELLAGALNSQKPEANLRRLQMFTERVPILPWDTEAALCYARIKTDLRRKGTPIGPYDAQIAGHALALGVTLVSNNLREFSRVDGLKLESWVELSS